MTPTDGKLLAATRAIDFIEHGMTVGLGTGTTATLFIRKLAQRVSNGLKVRCIASSQSSHELAVALSIPMTTFDQTSTLDLAVDGADEVGPGLSLIKGGGGALLREKIVISAADRFLVIVDASKQVDKLGHFPLPVEVIKMALPIVTRKLDNLGLKPSLRRSADGLPFLTDEDNYILDCACGSIDEPEQVAASIRSVIGVVEHGLFLHMATTALIGYEDRVVERSK